VVGHEAIKNSTSVLDYVFRALGFEYLGRTDFVHVKSVDETNEKPLASFNSPPRLPAREEAPVTEDKVTEKVLEKVKAGMYEVEAILAAKAQGYTGEMCMSCGSSRVKRNGACTVCEDCGSTSGCS
jgi:ribonucleoside-diphosphate reductase alpha chain